MIHYPISLLDGSNIEKCTNNLTKWEALVLRDISTEYKKMTGITSHTIKFIPGGTYELELHEGFNWRSVAVKIPAKTAIQYGMIAEICQRIEAGDGPFELGYDTPQDMGRIRNYVSRCGFAVSVRLVDSQYVMLESRDAGRITSISKGIRAGLDSFQIEGTESYVRQRVSAMNRDMGVDYSVRKISPGVFCVIRRITRDDSKVEAMYRTFLAVPSRFNADALIEVVRGMVDLEQR
jgi:hypothetical protein